MRYVLQIYHKYFRCFNAKKETNCNKLSLFATPNTADTHFSCSFPITFAHFVKGFKENVRCMEIGKASGKAKLYAVDDERCKRAIRKHPPLYRPQRNPILALTKSG